MNTIQFEAIKTALKQTKDGYGLSLAVHPDDLPEDLMRDFVGSRYMVVMVRIGDNEQPVNRELEFPGDHAVKMAGMMCRDPEFWKWEFVMCHALYAPMQVLCLADQKRQQWTSCFFMFFRLIECFLSMFQVLRSVHKAC